MKKRLSILAALIFTCLFVALSFWPWGWILIHGNNASKLANNELSGKTTPTPDEFVDYVIHIENGCAEFAAHDNEERVIVFCPNGIQMNSSKIGWSPKHVVGSWYSVELTGK